ncbi:MAG: oligosaccharide flippase family protein [Erysipelotrichaceae bacterium]|nr:oligosaccharide flippase family protein [Erysipelotrichaceae bacterium]
MSKKPVKQSLMVAALASSFGIFVSKALGLLYYSPLSALAGESNMAFYSITYTYYDLLLKISSAGIPFAIAALVARYYVKEDYKTVLLVKKLGISLIMCLSFVTAVIYIFVSGPLAAQSMGSSASPEDIRHLKDLFLILVAAVLLVPFLSSIRGYYQGLKRLDLYGSSQALEQFVRVFSIIFLAFLTVKILKLDSIYAIYCAIAAAAIAAFVTIIFFLFMTKEDDRRINSLIRTQKKPAVAAKLLVRELLSLGIPYLMISFLGGICPLVNTTFFLDTATRAGIEMDFAKLSMGILQANCNKLGSIPQVLTLGFSAGLVPYLVETLEQQDYKKLSKQIVQILDTVLYILLPVITIFIVFARDIYFIMYGNSNLDLGTELFRVSNLITFTDTIAPILSSIMITLRLRREAVLTLLSSIALKLLTFFPLVKAFGAHGMTYSSALSSLLVIVSYLLILKKKFRIRFVKTIRRTLFILLASLLSVLPVAGLISLIPFAYTSRILDILRMGFCGIMMLLLYYIISAKLSLPQVIFGIKKVTPRELLSRFRG